MKQKTFILNIKCAGDVIGDHDVNELHFDFGLDGKLRAFKDADLTRPVRITIGSTVTQKIPLKKSLGRYRRLGDLTK